MAPPPSTPLLRRRATRLAPYEREEKDDGTSRARSPHFTTQTLNTEEVTDSFINPRDLDTASRFIEGDIQALMLVRLTPNDPMGGPGHAARARMLRSEPDKH